MKRFLFGLVACLMIISVPIVSFGSDGTTTDKVPIEESILSVSVDHVDVITFHSADFTFDIPASVVNDVGKGDPSYVIVSGVDETHAAIPILDGSNCLYCLETYTIKIDFNQTGTTYRHDATRASESTVLPDSKSESVPYYKLE